MPKGYENIHLGMTREELRVARPNVTGLNLGLDPYVENPSGALMEAHAADTSNKVPNEMVIYAFEKTRLAAINFVYQERKGSDLLKRNLYKLGYFAEIKENGTILWLLENRTEIRLTLPLEWREVSVLPLSFQLVDAKFARNLNSYATKGVVESTQNETAFESFKARVAAFAEETLSDREDNDADAALRRLRPWLGLLFLFCALTGILVVIFRQSGAAARKRKPCR